MLSEANLASAILLISAMLIFIGVWVRIKIQKLESKKRRNRRDFSDGSEK